MDKETLDQRIALWRAIPINAKDETDIFIDALINRVEELENEVEELGYELIEAGEEW